MRGQPSTVEKETEEGEGQFVTLRVGGQLFALPVEHVRDVLRGLKVARMPLAPEEVVGALNLRGRVVTAISLRKCLGLPAADSVAAAQTMSVVVEHKGEGFSLIADAVGEVITLPVGDIERNPANLSARWKDVAGGVYKLKDELLVVLDVQKLLKL